MKKHILALAAMEKLLRLSGLRVSNDGKEALREILENKSEIIAKKAGELALHSGRKTIKAKDVELASK